MPKLKTHSGAKKRFNKLPSGKVKYKKQGKRHLLTPAKTKRIRRLRKAGLLNATDTATVSRRYLPYG
ncbi:MAG: 50S ribosomal protein L35 [Elusimicrobiota bacterium]